MAGMSQITIVGNVGRDMETRFLQDGTAVGKFTVAVTPPKYGTTEPETAWYSVSIFGNRAEKLAQYIKKGTQVLVIGPLTAKLYDKNDGGKGLDLSIRMTELTLLGTKGDNAGGGGWDGASKERPTFGGGDSKTTPFTTGASKDAEGDQPF